MTTENVVQQETYKRSLEFEAALTPVVINRLVKSGAMTLTHADELKSAYRKKQARIRFQAKNHAKIITSLRQTEVALVSDNLLRQALVLNAKTQLDAAAQLHTQLSAKLSTQEETLANVRQWIAGLQATPVAVGLHRWRMGRPWSATPTKTPKVSKAKKKKTSHKCTAYNLFVKLQSATIRVELGEAAKMRGAFLKEAGKRWKALDADGRTPYKTAADQHNAKMAADQQNQQATT
jgi:hypothetical protein